MTTTPALPGGASLLVPITGCIGQNTGFDGVSYQAERLAGHGAALEHDADRAQFKSPYTGSSPITGQYSRAA